MKKILKVSILLLGALFVLLGCSSEAKSEFALDLSDIKQKVTALCQIVLMKNFRKGLSN